MLSLGVQNYLSMTACYTLKDESLNLIFIQCFKNSVLHWEVAILILYFHAWIYLFSRLFFSSISILYIYITQLNCMSGKRVKISYQFYILLITHLLCRRAAHCLPSLIWNLLIKFSLNWAFLGLLVKIKVYTRLVITYLV